MNRLVPVATVLAIATVYLGYRVIQLKRQLHRAEYFVQSGLASVQQACTPVVELIRASDNDDPKLWDLATACFGQTDGLDEAEEWSRVRRDAKGMAHLIEQKLHVRRRLPWVSDSAPSRDRMPVDYYQEWSIPED